MGGPNQSRGSSVVEHRAENPVVVGSIPTLGSVAATALQTFCARRRHTARKRATPFNLKDAGRSPCPRLSRPGAGALGWWLGP